MFYGVFTQAGELGGGCVSMLIWSGQLEFVSPLVDIHSRRRPPRSLLANLPHDQQPLHPVSFTCFLHDTSTHRDTGLMRYRADLSTWAAAQKKEVVLFCFASAGSSGSCGASDFWYSCSFYLCFFTFRIRRSWGEMYSGHCRLCVCLSIAAFPHYCMDPDVSWGEW